MGCSLVEGSVLRINLTPPTPKAFFTIKNCWSTEEVRLREALIDLVLF